MALRIFETDPDAMPRKKSTFVNDIVGRFRAGMVEGNRPVALTEWRVTTGDPEVATTIAAMFGGHAREWETTREDAIQVLTESSKVHIVIDSAAKDITSKMVLWGANGAKIHECDGVEFLDDDRLGQPCGCPPLMVDRKSAAKKGIGPKPETAIRFRLADDPDLGVFRFQSASWDLVYGLHQTLNDLDAINGPAACALALEPVEFEAKSGPMKGRTVSYTKPVVYVNGAA